MFYMGSLIGTCSSVSEQCDILNSVNMASITAGGIADGINEMSLGGIAGIANYGTVKNCVNYGTVSYTGQYLAAYIGGMFGSTIKLNIHNCLNYGNIVYNGEISSRLYLGVFLVMLMTVGLTTA